MSTEPDVQHDREAPEAHVPPASLVPRWLALLVLIALLAASGFSVHALLTAEPARVHPSGQGRVEAPEAP